MKKSMVPPSKTSGKSKTSEQLERESVEMQLRLKIIQDKANEQQSKPTASQTSWNSAKIEKGSITTYKKDLQGMYPNSSNPANTSSSSHYKSLVSKTMEEIKQISNSPPAPPPLPPNQQLSTLSRGKILNEKTKISSQSNLMSKSNISSFNVDDWLCSIGMGQYIDTFTKNDITESVVRDLSLSDLDYMGITVLGHRKTIIKAVEDLRGKSRPSSNSQKYNQNSSSRSSSKPTTPLTDAPNNRQPIQQSLRSTSNVASEDKCDISDNKLKHWSEIKPISENVVKAFEDTIDEEAERKAFQAAVMEWRQSGVKAKVSIVRENELSESNIKTIAHAPVSTSSQEMNQDRNMIEHKTTSSFVAKDVDVTDDGMWRNPFASGLLTDRSESGKNRPTTSEMGSQFTSANHVNNNPKEKVSSVGGQTNSYDDSAQEEEHQEFVRAVQSWRQQGQSTSSSSGHISISVNNVSLRTERLASQLKDELELENQMNLKRLEESKLKELEILRHKYENSIKNGNSSSSINGGMTQNPDNSNKFQTKVKIDEYIAKHYEDDLYEYSENDDDLDENDDNNIDDDQVGNNRIYNNSNYSASDNINNDVSTTRSLKATRSSNEIKLIQTQASPRNMEIISKIESNYSVIEADSNDENDDEDDRVSEDSIS